eukprot:7085509-Prymnesium_polylepis.1
MRARQPRRAAVVSSAKISSWVPFAPLIDVALPGGESGVSAGRSAAARTGEAGASAAVPEPPPLTPSPSTACPSPKP